jgi:hypothetical protein
LLFDDPRGRSPFDVMVGIENQLRYGAKGKSGFGVDPAPPFDGQTQFEPRAGTMVLFPPWLVHSVPCTPMARPDETEAEADENARAHASRIRWLLVIRASDYVRMQAFRSPSTCLGHGGLSAALSNSYDWGCDH